VIQDCSPITLPQRYSRKFGWAI